MKSNDQLDQDEPSMPDITWDIRRAGRRWAASEARGRFALTPEKFEMSDGRLFWSDAERLTLLGLLLENVGVDAAVRLGEPEVWRGAIRDLR
ncbi:MAG: hypothetical protein ACM3NS_05475 [Deltaproteobacteria bacterium]